jgi:hypothetical protein
MNPRNRLERPRGRPAPPMPARKRVSPAPLHPKVPSSHAERRRMLKATLYRLSRLVRIPASRLKVMPLEEVAALVDRVPQHDQPGEARRLAAKLVRLKGMV